MTQLAMFALISSLTMVSAAASASAADLAATESAAIRSMNHSGLELIRQTIKTEVSSVRAMKNVVVSPLSAYSAFAMLHGGLEGKSHQLFDQFLHVDPNDDATFDTRSSALINSLRLSPDPNEPRRPGFATKPTLGISNSAWATTGETKPPRFEFASKFAQSLESNYLADVKSIDFATAPAADQINSWAFEKTNKLIPKVITSDVLNNLSWILLNASYLEANWATKFEIIKATVGPSFRLLNGRKIAVDLIGGHGQMNIVETNEYRAVELPFYGSDLSFFAVMPRNEGTFADWTMKGIAFTDENWTNLVAAFNRYATSPEAASTEVTVRMPKFSITSSESMLKGQPLTTAMGLDFLFQPENASDLAPLGGFVGQEPGAAVTIIKQDAKIVLDENGIRAAAVTQVGGVGRTSRPDFRYKKFITFDRPFWFFIGSKVTGVMLFTGTVVNPSLI